MQKKIRALVIALILFHGPSLASSMIYRILAPTCGTSNADIQAKNYFDQAYQATKETYPDQNLQPILVKNMHSFIANGIAPLLEGDLAFSLFPGYTHINKEAFKQLTPDEASYTAYHETALHKLNAPTEIGKSVLKFSVPMAIALACFCRAYIKKSYLAAGAAVFYTLVSISRIYKLPGQCRAYEEAADKCVAQILEKTGKKDLLERLAKAAAISGTEQSTWHPSDEEVAKNLTVAKDS